MTTAQRLATGFIVLYLALQIATPAIGVRARQDGLEFAPFSWHMFSSIADDADQ